MSEGQQDQEIRPGERFGQLRKMYTPPREKAGQILKEEGVTGRQFRRSRARFARELLKKDIDAVTGLPVRKVFEEQLEAEVARSQRYNHPLTMIIVDLNNLKKINEEGGYPAGDKALRTVAELLSESLRKTDFVARYGGDEFGILLTETPLTKVDGWWDRFNKKLEATPYTVSAGVMEVDFEDIEGTRSILSEAVLHAKTTGQRAKNHLVKHFQD